MNDLLTNNFRFDSAGGIGLAQPRTYGFAEISEIDLMETIAKLWAWRWDTHAIATYLGLPEAKVYSALVELRDLYREDDRRQRYDLSTEIRA